jgi:DNA-binding Lrp family transcriptional regulator
MDKIDSKLLKLLQEDASRTNAELAELVALSPSSCLRRVQRLKKSGVINRVVALLNPAKVGRGIKAIITVELERHGEQYMRQFLDMASREQVVTQAYRVSGQIDAVLMLRLKDMEELEAVCERLFRNRSNVARYYTMFVTQTAKEETAMPL